MTVTDIVAENGRRRAEMVCPYDPILGIGSPVPREPVRLSENATVWLPKSMLDMPAVSALVNAGSVMALLESLGQYSAENESEFLVGLSEERFKHDFEFWAFTTVKIQDKETKEPIPFKLNRGQRKLLAQLEAMRIAGIPIRIILLKARQWGGSTLTQIYMAWIQLLLKNNWHSAIIADVENQARNIRGMFSKLANNYPAEVGAITFKPYEGSTKNRLIEDRGCIIGVGSAQQPDSLRSFDFAMLHMSEVGLWKSTPTRSAEDLAQSVAATVPDFPYTLVVKESTAKGVGNYFHREWQAAVNSESNYAPVFVAWWEIERYQRPVEDYEKLIATFKDYDWYLWEQGATLEGIAWYRHTKASENYDDWRMKSEYPSSPDEAFQSTGRRAFAPSYVIRARKTCRKPDFVGDLFADSIRGKEALSNIQFNEIDKGLFWVWSLPDTSIPMEHRYCVFTDIGGRTDKADWSVITVLDRYYMTEGGIPEVVATWRGHLDQDLVAWKAAQIAKFYGDALLAVEVNSLDKQSSEGDHSLTVLDTIVDFYPNLYTRTDPSKVAEGIPIKYGFHTNVSTKVMIIDCLNAGLRDGGFIERDQRACDEYDYYEIKPNGSYGAVDGEHDDLVVTRAGSYWLATSYMPPPRIIPARSTAKRKARIVNEASI